LEHEVFGIVHLDNRMRWLGYTELFRGTIDGATVHPREVVKDVLGRNSARSSWPLPPKRKSRALPGRRASDFGRLREGLALIDVRIVDHVIVAVALATHSPHTVGCSGSQAQRAIGPLRLALWRFE